MLRFLHYNILLLLRCNRLAAAKLNMETALEDAEYMAEELERWIHHNLKSVHNPQIHVQSSQLFLKYYCLSRDFLFEQITTQEMPQYRHKMISLLVLSCNAPSWAAYVKYQTFYPTRLVLHDQMNAFDLGFSPSSFSSVLVECYQIVMILLKLDGDIIFRLLELDSWRNKDLKKKKNWNLNLNPPWKRSLS